MNLVQVICKLFGGRELLYINVGMWRSNLRHVGTIENNRDDIVGEDVEELLGDVVLAHAVFQGEVELVRLVEPLVAVCGYGPVTLEITTGAKNINLDMFPQRLDQLLSFTFSFTI